MNDEHISDEDYKHAEYHNMYLMSDILQFGKELRYLSRVLVLSQMYKAEPRFSEAKNIFQLGYLGIPNEIAQISVFISGRLVEEACSHCFVSFDSLFCFLFWYRVTKTVRGPLRDRQI